MNGAVSFGAMSTIDNPALRQFCARMGESLVLAQVLIRRAGAGYELRQVEDGEVAAESLRRVTPAEARRLAQFTGTGEFRPLKSAPTLARGWLMAAANERQLELALAGLYPGALADWHAAAGANPPVTPFRDFVNRQSGMYRIAAKLSDAQAAEVIGAGCDASRCLKRRLWTVDGLAPDGPEGKSLIPCLEPCAVLLEMLRLAGRAARERGEIGACNRRETE